jgi:hypothetical protein
VRKAVFVAVASLLLAAISSNAQAATVKGLIGQVFTSSATSVKSGAVVIVSGSHFDETVGIYLGFCVVPKKGTAPTPCGGGINKTGVGDASFWISSNPPPYGVGLAKEFLPGGRFKESIKISRMIGKFDCTKVRCAITVRADHLRSEDRSYDLFIPITIKK